MLRDLLSNLPPIYGCDAVRQIERRFVPNAIPTLMERAGAAAAAEVLRTLQGKRGKVLIAAGPGNNGGDAFVVARHLRQTGYDVTLAFAGDPARLAADAHSAWSAWVSAGGDMVAEIPSIPFDLAVDGLFGIGLQRPITGLYADWIECLNQMTCPVLALDIPSGLDSDTGRVLGRAVRATHTATFIALKPGMLTLDGPDHCGTISIHELGLDCASVLPATGHLLTESAYTRQLRPRLRNTHKGSNGNAIIIGGARGMTGAALLSSRAALKSGTGRVFVGLLDTQAPTLDLQQPELMLRSATELLTTQTADAIAIGPGLGRDDTANVALRLAIAYPAPLVLDADALNLLGANRTLAEQIAARQQPTILTPHPAEAARLLGCDTFMVQADRIKAANALANRFNAGVVLKGCGSIVAYPNGQWLINNTGNPGLASAGMGDVLTGLIVSLLAQGWPADTALLAAVHIHGLAADRLVAQGYGPTGLTASEVIDAIRTEINLQTRHANLIHASQEDGAPDEPPPPVAMQVMTRSTPFPFIQPSDE